MKKWECTICGYIHEGENPPDECPVCGADSNAFIEVTEQAAPETPEEDTAEKRQDEEKPVPETLLEKATALILQFHLHPITVHTPNGIIPFAFILLILTPVFGLISFETAAFYSLVFVLLNMPVVLYTGYVTWQKKYKGAMTSLFKLKIGASIAATVLLTLLVIWRLVQPEVMATPSSGRMMFIFLALLLLAAVGIAGHMGGKLVFGVKKSS